MKELYELKDKLCEELKEYGKKDMSAGSLDVVDKLTHTIKNLDKIIENYDDGYSNYSGDYSRRNGNSYRDSRGRYSNNYSYHNDMVGELRHLMNDAPDERTRQEFQSFIRKMESM